MEHGQNQSASRQEPEMKLAVTDARIAWVLDNAHVSEWLKQALRAAEGLNPIILQNDVEMLRHLILPRVHAQIEMTISATHVR